MADKRNNAVEGWTLDALSSVALGEGGWTLNCFYR